MTTRMLAEIDQDAGPTTATVPRLIDADQIAELLQVSKRQLQRLVHDGEFPKPLLVGGCRRWAASDFNAYVAKLRAEANKPARRHA